MKFEKVREDMAFIFFFVGLCSIPFWFPFVLESIVGLILSLFLIELNTKIISSIFVCLYSFMLISIGFGLLKDKNNIYSNIAFPIMCILSGFIAILLFVF